jgi:4-amino-4-deoxy-L-arabinose transferase-like glycosyltransferase
MGNDDVVDVDEALEHRSGPVQQQRPVFGRSSTRLGWIVVSIASLVFLTNIISPPHLMDDVDAVQAQIARNMLASGDWVTARLDGVAYLEKSPLVYWMMAVSYRIFGVTDWAARLPIALMAVLLCWVVYRFGRWAFDAESGLYAGLAIASCVGLYLFTRVLIPDVIVTLTMTVAIWCCLRSLEPGLQPSAKWTFLLGLALGLGLLLKGLIAIVFPGLAVLAYMAVTGQLLSRPAWGRLRLWIAIPVMLLVASPWHLLAILRNPPYFTFSMHSGPGLYHGFFWFYFINEHLLRFLGRRYPYDYNTVPRSLFFLLNLVWLFPWSVYLLAAPKLSYRSSTRAGRTRLMALCWTATVLLFFAFSTTQEYYSMPIYPALALLIGPAVRSGKTLALRATDLLIVVFALLSCVLLFLLARVWNIPPVGDLYGALTQDPEMYTLSLGHMSDLTMGAFVFLKLPLAIAAIAFILCTLGLIVSRKDTFRTVIVLSLGMVLFFQAARVALVRFDTYLGSYPLAVKLQQSPPGKLMEADAYYAFSSVFFYTNKTALLLNGRFNNLEYGSYAPGAPQVFINDAGFVSLWTGASRYYLLLYGTDMPHIQHLVSSANIFVVAENSGNYLVTNQAIP